MGQIRTHYDNLQVSRAASAEVIKAAYRSLSIKFHPDRNPGNADCAKVMRLLNASYAVLSDPIRRRRHDEWIKSKEIASAAQKNQGSQQGAQRANHSDGSGAGSASNPRSAESGSPKRPERTTKNPSSNGDGIFALKGLAFLAAAGIMIYLTYPSLLPSIIATHDQNASTEQRVDKAVDELFGNQAAATDASKNGASKWSIDPITEAPNGSPWPQSAGYVAGYPRLRATGHSTVTVDNSSNSADVFVKLVEIGPDRTMPVRQIYIPKYGTFEMGSLEPGTYDVRYMDLSDGGLARSESFVLKQSEDEEGVSFNNITMTLYKVANGNMQTYPLSPSEF